MFEALGQVDFIGLSARAANALDEFKQLIDQMTNMQDYLSVTELTEEILEKTGYREALKIEKRLKHKAVWKILTSFYRSPKTLKNKMKINHLSPF